MNWEVEAIAAKDFLKEVEVTKGLDITNEIDEALAKFKNSDEFVALLKKDHDAGFDAKVEAIFYNIWAHYQDLDYAILRGELTDLIGEWLKYERLNALKVVPSPIPPSPLTGNVIEIETVKASKQQPVVEVDKGTATPNPHVSSEDPASEPSSRVAVVQSLINLEEEPVATDVEEGLEAAIDLTTV